MAGSTLDRIDLFRIFTRVVDAASFTRAADTLGLPLFEQIGRDISLTPAGELLLQATRELDDVWNRFESSIDDLKGLKRGKLRVALVTTAMTGPLLSWMERRKA